MKTCLVALFFLYCLFSFSQNSNIHKKGVVVSKLDSVGLAYINVYSEINKIGTVTNEMGSFLLELTDSLINSEITFSSIGFLTKRIKFNKISDTVFLIPATETLKEITISNKIPKFEKIIDSIYVNLKKNYSNRRYLLKTFYRQTTIKDSAYLRIIEADVDIQEYGIKKPLDRDRIKVNYYRRSNNNLTEKHNRLWKTLKVMSSFITNTRGINELVWIQQENFIDHFAKTKAFNIYYKNLLKSFVFDYEYTTYINKQPVYVFTFYNKSLEGLELTENQLNRIYVNSSDYAVVKYERIKGYKRGNTFNNFGKIIINYSKIGDYYYLTSILKHFYSESIGLKIDKLHTYQIFTNRKDYEKIKRKQTENKNQDFGERKYQYDSIFWNNYNMLKEVPLDVKLKSLTEKNKTLKKQYIENATKKEY